MEKVLVTIPVYNETKHITEITSGIQAKGYDYLIIDDGSHQETKEIINEKQLVHLTHSENKGQGAALRSGFKYAIKNKYQFVIHFDGDGQHRLEDLEAILEPLLSSKLDIVFGSRFLTKESAKEIPLSKRLILRLARIFEGLRTGIWLSDAHCGIRALRVNSCLNMRFSSDGMAHASEIVSETKRLSLEYAEVPVFVTYYVSSDNKSNFYRIFSILKELTSIR